MININMKPEYIFSVAKVDITNTLFTSFLVTIFLTVFSVLFFISYKNKKYKINIFFKVIILELVKLIDKVTSDKKLTDMVLPLIATFFIFIISANLLALFPGFLGSFFIQVDHKSIPLLRSPNSDLTTTLALAIFSVVFIQIFSLKILGVKKFILRFVNLTNPIKFILGVFELISELVRILSFSFRLYGNIFAGEVLLLIITYLSPYLFPLPFMVLEIFVGTIQAFIFAMLTLAFISAGIANKK